MAFFATCEVCKFKSCAPSPRLVPKCSNRACLAFGQPLFSPCPPGFKYVAGICKDKTYLFVNEKSDIIKCPCCSVTHFIDTIPFETFRGQSIFRTFPGNEGIARRLAEIQKNLQNNKNAKMAVQIQRNQELQTEIESLKVVHQMVVMECDSLRDMREKVKVEPVEATVACDPIDKTLLQQRMDLLSQKNLCLEKEVKEKTAEIAKNIDTIAKLTRDSQFLKQKQAVVEKERHLAQLANKRLHEAQIEARAKIHHLEGKLKDITENEEYQLWLKAKDHKAYFDIFLKEAQKSLSHADQFGKMAMKRLEEMKSLCVTTDSHSAGATNEAIPSPAFVALLPASDTSSEVGSQHTTAIQKAHMTQQILSTSAEMPDHQKSPEVTRKRDTPSPASDSSEYTVPMKVRRDGNAITFDFSSLGQTLSGNTETPLDLGKVIEKLMEQGQSAEGEKSESAATEASGIEERPEKSSGEEENPEKSETSHDDQESLSSEVSADPTEASAEEPKDIEATQEAEDEQEDEWPADFTYEMDESTWFDSCDEMYLDEEEDHRPARG